MVWDDELEELAVRVSETFGEDAVIEAVMRAVRSVAAVSSEHVDGEVVSIADAIVVLKAELRRILAVH
jgi:hypothetical protein